MSFEHKKTFQVVDGNSFWDKKDAFVDLYNKNVHTKDIKSELGLSPRQYMKLVNECGEEGLIIPRRKTKRRLE